MAYTVLIADDEKEIRSVLRLYLENAGYRVLEAADGIEAERIFASEKVDLCLLDIMMPGKDGYQVLRGIRSVSNIPVIMITAKDQDPEKILGLDLGADDYMVKPFNPLEAVARTNSMIRRYYRLGAAAAGAPAAPPLQRYDPGYGSLLSVPGRQPDRADFRGIQDHAPVHGASRQGIYQAADL